MRSPSAPPAPPRTGVWAAADAATAAALKLADPPPKPHAPLPALSIRASFSPASAVLLTGAAGYVGSVVLEHLLRGTPCPTIYVLVRSKAGVDPAARVDRLLARPLFAGLHAPGGAARLPPATRARVAVVAGDLQAPRLGLADRDWDALTATTTHVIHCAASISFTAPARDLLSQNYAATGGLLALAGACARLASFVHVSTAYVQAHLGRGGLAGEALADLDLGGPGETHATLAARLAAAPDAAAAEAVARAALAATGLPNAYCLTKHLAECLVAEAARSASFGVSIVRPTIVAALSQHAPHPAAVGYVGNAAGFTSVFLAYALGLVTYSCHQPASIFDLVPGDVAAGVVVAAGAAAAEAAGARAPPLVFHAASSTTNPITLIDLMLAVHRFVEANKPPLRFALAYPGRSLSTVHRRFMAQTSLRFRALNALTAAKFGLIRAGLRAAGKADLAAKVADGRAAWALYAPAAMDFDLRFGVAATAALAARLPADEAAAFRCLWRAEGGEDGWAPYLDAYFRGVAARHFPSAAGKAAVKAGKAAGAAATAAAPGRVKEEGASPPPPPPPPLSPATPPKPARAFRKVGRAKVAVVPVVSPAAAALVAAKVAAPAPVAAAKVAAPASPTSTLAAKAGRLLTRPMSALSVHKLAHGTEE